MDALKPEIGIAANGGPALRPQASLWRPTTRAAPKSHAASSSNFYYAFMLLPAERRRALYAVYAFCRFVDDIADDESIRRSGRDARAVAEELDHVFEGVPTRPVSRALADNVRRFNIPRRYFEEVIAGVEMDLSRRRYRDASRNCASTAIASPRRSA